MTESEPAGHKKVPEQSRARKQCKPHNGAASVKYLQSMTNLESAFDSYLAFGHFQIVQGKKTEATEANTFTDTFSCV